MRVLNILLLLIFNVALFGQSWQEVELADIPSKGKKDIQPEVFRLYEIDDIKFQKLLWTAPSEKQVIAGETEGILIDFPSVHGEMDKFFIHEYSMMEEGLAQKYSHIKTFKGFSRKDKSTRIRIDYTEEGLRAVITSPHGMYYIDHYQRSDKDHRIFYARENYSIQKNFVCSVGDSKIKDSYENNDPQKFLLNECELKEYRYAQTATGEYSAYYNAADASQSGLVLSAVVTTMNRVNQIYEQDLTVRFVLINNTDQLFYYDEDTDPFDGSNSGTMINDNQTNTDAVIGAANYDIGHIFSTGGSGLAGLGVVCSSGKARGVTGISNPVGDPFDIDYVAHEIGHQCGGNHTQNNSCNRSGTSVEVGSGFTIMGYAGICSPNVINNSIAMFNVANIVEMSTYLDNQSCHQTVTLTNAAPVSSLLEDKIIPASTPFVLNAVVSDADGDVLTHTWEQQDAEVATMPPDPTNTGGPTFRAYLPTTNSARYFPRLSDLTTGTSFQWEVLPSVSREMNFTHVARDHSIVVGCIDTTNVQLTVDGSAGPFNVTSQSSATTYVEYDNVTISWDVANTKTSSVNAKLVDILYSRDGGLTYPDTLVKDTRNDGSKVVVIPPGLESDARFMVKPSGNYFFDINEANLTVTDGSSSYKMICSDYYEKVCAASGPVTFDISAIMYEGFSGDINVSLVNVPAGLSATLSQNTISDVSPATITLENFASLSGEYIIEIIASKDGVTRIQEFFLDVTDVTALVSLNEPVDGSLEIENNPVLKWTTLPDASSYQYEIATEAGILIESGTSVGSSVSIQAILGNNKNYKWRVRAVFPCGVADFSDYFSFSTGDCLNIKNTNPLVIPTTASTVSASVNIPFSGTISDVNIIGLDVAHTWISDLQIRVKNPANASEILYDKTCGQDDDINLSYDDASATVFDCGLRTSGDTIQPVGTLASFNTSDLNGTWQLEVEDVANQDGGTVNSWTLEICYESSCNLIVNKLAYDDGSGSLKDAIDCAQDGDEITFDPALGNNVIIDLQNEKLLIEKNISFAPQTSQSVSIISSSTDAALEIAIDKYVAFKNFRFENLTTNKEVILNNGTLILENSQIKSSASSLGLNNKGNVEVKGLNRILEN